MASLSDRFNINAQLEHLQAKYVGTGHPDINRFEVRGDGLGVVAGLLRRLRCTWARHASTPGGPDGAALPVRLFPTPPLPPNHSTPSPPLSPPQWNLNIKRDTYASLIGHQTLTAYHAIAENESIGRVKYGFLQVRDLMWRSLSVAGGLHGLAQSRCGGRRCSPSKQPCWNERCWSASRHAASRSPPCPQNMLLPCGLPPEKEEE